MGSLVPSRNPLISEGAAKGTKRRGGAAAGSARIGRTATYASPATTRDTARRATLATPQRTITRPNAVPEGRTTSATATRHSRGGVRPLSASASAAVA